MHSLDAKKQWAFLAAVEQCLWEGGDLQEVTAAAMPASAAFSPKLLWSWDWQFFVFNVYVFIYVVMPGLGCDIQDL